MKKPPWKGRLDMGKGMKLSERTKDVIIRVATDISVNLQFLRLWIKKTDNGDDDIPYGRKQKEDNPQK